MWLVACVYERVPNPPWRAWQAQGQVREAKDAEKEVMDKYLDLFKQHTTADERLVCLRAALAHACLCRRLCLCCHARDSTVVNAARRLRMPMLLAPLSSLLPCILARLVWCGVLCSAGVRQVINSCTCSAPTMTASSKYKKKTLACISRSSAPSTPASRRRPPRRHASSLFAMSASARLRR